MRYGTRRGEEQPEPGAERQREQGGQGGHRDGRPGRAGAGQVDLEADGEHEQRDAQARERGQLRPGCAFVTGVSRGIGRAVVLELAAAGHDVAGCFLTGAAEAESLADEVKQLGRRTLFAPCDVRDKQAVEELVERADTEVGPLTALVGNAGITRNAPVALMPEAAWRDALDVNLTGVWNVCQPVLFRFMRRRRGRSSPFPPSSASAASSPWRTTRPERPG